MQRAQVIALWIITLVLVADAAMKYAVPGVVLFLHRDAYLRAALQCEEALANLQESEALASSESAQTGFALRQSAMVGLMDCYERQHLRRVLLASRVSPHDLDAVDLEARMASNANLPYLVEDLRGP